MRLITRIPVIGFLLCGLFFCTACGSDAVAPAPPTSTAPATPPKPKANAKPVPKFDMDSAYAYVAAQVDFGPRVVNSQPHRDCREWLVRQLEAFGATVEEQNFTATAYTGTTLNGTNIIARYNPQLQDRILLAAHWDTRHIADSDLETDPNAVVEGADDGASGVGVLLEIARQLGLSTPDIGVDIVLFDAEDYGDSGGDPYSWGLGSQHYARTLGNPRPRYGVLLDMVGGRNPQFAKEKYSVNFAPNIVNKVWKLAYDMNFGQYFPDKPGGGVLDDHFFVNSIAKVPMIDIINFREETESGFVAHWHTGNDGIDAIDKRSLRAVGQVVTALVYREAAGTL